MAKQRGGRVTPSKKAAAATASGNRRGARVPNRAERDATRRSARTSGTTADADRRVAARAAGGDPVAESEAGSADGIGWGPVDVVVWVVIMFAVLALVLPVLWLLVGRALGYQLAWPAGPGATAGELSGRLGVGQPPSLERTFADVPLELQTALQIPLWLVMLAGPLLVARRKGNGIVRDFGFRMARQDLPLGVAVGVASQLVLVPVFYRLLFVFTGEQDVSAEARELTNKATSPLGIAFLVLIVGVGAPICEELFYRGLVLRALARRWSPLVAVVGSSALFALFHFQPLQFPALFLFGAVLGVVTVHTDRLGPALWAHVAFNLTSVVLLVGDITWPPR